MNGKFYLENPYIREVEARIVDKTYRNGKYYIKLNRTIFYPHLSGGQPGDQGNINGIPVKEVYEKNGQIIHVIDKNIYSNTVTLNIDWDNRLDNMQQHTGQHLLSAAFYKLYNVETVGFHLGKDYVYIDVDMPNLTEKEARRVEVYANKIITSNFEIKAYYIEKKELEKVHLREKAKINSNIRIVEIDNIDFSPCGGTHLKYTGEIGLIKIRKWEKHKENIRVEFVCGNRALLDYKWKNNAINKISVLLSSKDKDSFEKVKILYEEKNQLEKENRKLKEEITQYKGEEIFKSAFKIKNTLFISKIFENKDPKEVDYIANFLSKKYDLIQIYGLKNNEQEKFLVNISTSIDINLKNILQEISSEYEIKGGGTRHSVQGKVVKGQLESVMAKFFEKVKA